MIITPGGERTKEGSEGEAGTAVVVGDTLVKWEKQ